MGPADATSNPWEGFDHTKHMSLLTDLNCMYVLGEVGIDVVFPALASRRCDSVM